VSELLARGRGATWSVLLSREPYGLHFSVSGPRRKPTNREVDAARDSLLSGGHDVSDLIEVTTELERLGWRVNPYVRHWLPREHARAIGGWLHEERTR
jgi:hypothetical protein